MATRRLEIKQRIMAMFVIVIMLIMIFSTLEYKRILADSVTMSQTVSGVALSMSTVASLTMNSAITIGTATNSLGNLNIINAIDYRGTGAGWTVSMYTSNWNQLAREAGTNNLSNDITYITPPLTFGKYNGASGDGMAIGTICQLDSACTILNASTNNGMGILR